MANQSKPTAPTQDDIKAAPGIPLPPKPSTSSAQVGGGFEPQGELNNMNDVRFEQPTVNQKAIEPASNSLTMDQVIAALGGAGAIDTIVEKIVEQRLIAAGVNPADAAQPKLSKAEAPKFDFLKHYRYDGGSGINGGELTIPEYDMSASNPRLSPLRGQEIRFRRGHFFAVTENQVAQIEWMRQQPILSADGQSAGGGMPGIYEDSGEVIYHCPQGCDFETVSMDRYRAHMASVHQVA